jgi:hypothetical protein
MPGVTYEIGKAEKHLLEVDYSKWTGKIRLVLDGRELTDAQKFLGGKKKLEFEIGNAEKHKVELDVATYGNQFELRIDGKAKVAGGLSY